MFENDLYVRYELGAPDEPFFGQVLVINPERSRMQVDVDDAVVGVDFRHESTRPDVPGHYRPRPGILLADRLGDLAHRGRRAVLVNGNNVGYWGNQFAIDGKRLVAKERGPIFDDGRLTDHVSGWHPFFCWSRERFTVRQIRLKGELVGGPDTVLTTTTSSAALPDSALSGLPVMWGGRPVWADHLEHAWDPRLVFEVGRLVDVTRWDTVALIRRSRAVDTPLALHAMTAVGIDRSGLAVLIVIEQSERSRGISLDGMAQLMERFEVHDGVVLGAAGDAQLATTDEGFLVAPVVTAYTQAASRLVSRDRPHAGLGPGPVRARPVPSLVTFALRAADQSGSWAAVASARQVR